MVSYNAQDGLRYLVNLTHILTQQQGNPNKISTRCQSILFPHDPPVAGWIHGRIESLSPPCYFERIL
jgi:hypothetical protein